LDEAELMGCLALKPELFKLAIGRGKGILRTRNSEKRQTQGFDRWQLYEVLKGNRPVDDMILTAAESMPAAELREGLLEFLLMMKRTS
jgi:hypothetical protein